MDISYTPCACHLWLAYHLTCLGFSWWNILLEIVPRLLVQNLSGWHGSWAVLTWLGHHTRILSVTASDCEAEYYILHYEQVGIFTCLVFCGYQALNKLHIHFIKSIALVVVKWACYMMQFLLFMINLSLLAVK